MNKIKGTDTNDELDYEANLWAGGVAGFKAVLRANASYSSLPEY